MKISPAVSFLTVLKQLGNGERGMGLAESVIAVAIISIALTTFIVALSTGSRAVGELGQEVISQQLAQSQLEQIKAAAYDATGNSYTLVPAPSSYSISLSVNSALYTNSNIQKITVTVNRDSQPVLVVEEYKVNR